MTTKFEIRKTLVLSTAHLRQESAESLMRGRTDTISEELEYGIQVYVEPFGHVNPTHPRFEAMPELYPIWKAAHDQDCGFLFFDRDGEQYDCFESFDW